MKSTNHTSRNITIIEVTWLWCCFQAAGIHFWMKKLRRIWKHKEQEFKNWHDNYSSHFTQAPYLHVLLHSPQVHRTFHQHRQLCKAHLQWTIDVPQCLDWRCRSGHQNLNYWQSASVDRPQSEKEGAKASNPSQQPICCSSFFSNRAFASSHLQHFTAAPWQWEKKTSWNKETHESDKALHRSYIYVCQFNCQTMRWPV